ncbi:MAG: hypothetical protein R3F59_03980 [Myxococcota bacterium]
MVWALALGSAWGADGKPAGAALELEPSDEIVVYGDDFARWDHTRWLVLNELWFPFGATFAADRNRQFDSFAFQIRAVLLCDKDDKLSKRRWEVSCHIEDIGLQATSLRRWKREKDREVVQQVLDELDGKLTGMAVQMQVADDGGVQNFDLEGVTADNDREITIQETLRQVLSRMMAGFHLRIPEHAQRAGQWVEYHSELMDLPSLTSSRGNTQLVHLVTPREGLQIVQSVGNGSASVAIPVTQRDAFAAGQFDELSEVAIDKASGATAATPDDSVGESASKASMGSKRESSIEATYQLEASGVAVFRKSDGIMTERIWTVDGKPTAGSAGGTTSQPAPFRNMGRIQQLGPDEKPDVGPTRQVAWPGRAMEGLPAWETIETVPD